MRKKCLDTIYDIAKKDKKVVFIGSDLGAGVLSEFKKKYPNQFFMEGISEQHIIGFAAGLALQGFIPYVNTIATFLTRRCYEQIAIDLCLHNLPVRLIANGGGLVYSALGPTHQAIEDISIMRSLPNMSVFSVSDEKEMKELILQSKNYKGPMYIRLAKGGDRIISHNRKFFIGKNVIYKQPDKITLVSTGVSTQECLDALEKLNVDDRKKVGLIHVHTIKPFDEKKFINIIKNTKTIITVEEHTKINGLGSLISDIVTSKLNNKIKIIKLGLPDKFNSHYGTQQELFNFFKIDSKNISRIIKEELK